MARQKNIIDFSKLLLSFMAQLYGATRSLFQHDAKGSYLNALKYSFVSALASGKTPWPQQCIIPSPI
ncbi:MAG: hypothetical protein PUK63_07735 [Clostridiales bacterium]|nr:hypothetical protein [Clostridiales bacterium]MDY3061339.1 hypothetical protein [Eubacteriales bacterium]